MGLVLRAVENASLRHQREDELSKAIKTAEEKWMPLHSNESAAAYPLFEERRKDQASHYILRLAFCSSPSSISWFIAQECLLFRIRFHNELGRERADFLKRCNAHLRPVEEEERTQQPLLDLLRRSSPGKEGDEFYKVPFELVPDLVARRGCLVRGGYAYVPKSDSFSIVMTRFRENLEFWVERTSRELTTLKDERLLPLLQLVKTSEAAAAAAAHPSDAARGFVEGRLTAADIDAVHYRRSLATRSSTSLTDAMCRRVCIFHSACCSCTSEASRTIIYATEDVSNWDSSSRCGSDSLETATHPPPRPLIPL